MEPVGAGAGGGSDPGLINGFVDRLRSGTIVYGIICVLWTFHGGFAGVSHGPYFAREIWT